MCEIENWERGKLTWFTDFDIDGIESGKRDRVIKFIGKGDDPILVSIPNRVGKLGAGSWNGEDGGEEVRLESERPSERAGETGRADGSAKIQSKFYEFN